MNDPSRAELEREIAELRRNLARAEEMKRRRDELEWLAFQRERMDAIAAQGRRPYLPLSNEPCFWGL